MQGENKEMIEGIFAEKIKGLDLASQKKSRHNKKRGDNREKKPRLLGTKPT